MAALHSLWVWQLLLLAKPSNLAAMHTKTKPTTTFSYDWNGCFAVKARKLPPAQTYSWLLRKSLANRTCIINKPKPNARSQNIESKMLLNDHSPLTQLHTSLQHSQKAAGDSQHWCPDETGEGFHPPHPLPGRAGGTK